MKNNLGALVAGFVFSIGLGLAGMADPRKVLGFLDVFGSWDPSLAFVMVGAIGVHLVSYPLIRKRRTPLWATEWHLPRNSKLTPSLIAGSVLFGIGWGLAGYCPGPALTSLASFGARPFLFVFGMALGMLVFRAIDRKIGFKR